MPTAGAGARDDDDDFSRGILMRGCIGIAVASALGLLVRFALHDAVDAGTIVGVIALTTCGVSVHLVRSGRTRFATVVFLSLSWVLVAAISLARGPDYPATIPLYLLLILLAGLLRSSTAAIVLAVLSTLSTMAIMLAHDLELVHHPEHIGVAYRALSAAIVIIVVTVTFLAALRRLRDAHTALKEKNEELERTRASLADQVEQRTRSLVVARDAAEAASRTKTAFVANMSHELRTPMNAVLGSTDVLLQTRLDENQRALAQTIREGGDALLAVLNDVLDLRAIEAGRLSVARAPFEPRAVAADVAGLLRTGAAQSGLRIEVSVDDDVPSVVNGDGRRVRQVLLNLVGNAVKFSERGVVEVRIAAGSGRVRFAVTDSGVGIARDDTERIFLPFTQIDSSSTRRRGGIGLGLAISRELASLMGGSLSVESELGQGSTFTFEIPVDSAPAVDVAAAPASASTARLPSELRLLVAEDNEVNVRVLVRMLAVLGQRADVVSTGAAALAAVRRATYDCVLMDIHMPEMDGVEATRRIRAEHPTPPTVVAVTADALPEQRAELRAAGFDDVITKPILLESLTSALARVVVKRPKNGIEA